MSQTASQPRRPIREEAFARVTGAPLVAGNGLRLLRDGPENYPAWLAAIEQARSTVHLEMYIFRADVIGRRFRDLLAEKAASGVRVRVLYDWFGSLRPLRRSLWPPLLAAGAEVRVSNPPARRGLLGWASRDHRKMLAVDGEQAFVAGLCIGDPWVGNPEKGIAPWRDTGVELRGPAVADVEAAFAQTWALAGPPIPPRELPQREELSPAGDVGLRVVATAPETTGLYRMDLLVAAAARERLWLTDAYFMATAAYRQALREAAGDGVDVRLLLPNTSDVPWVRGVSRTMYRSLLEAGVRIFEWNGPMVHAKTAVADGVWGRVGSTNLNLSSWIGNWELDVAIESRTVAAELERMFLDDLASSTEILLPDTVRRRALVRAARSGVADRRRKERAGSGLAHARRTRMLSSAASVGSMVGAAVRGHRILRPTESAHLTGVALALLALAGVASVWPRVVGYGFAGLVLLAALSLLIEALRLRRGRSREIAGPRQENEP